MNVTKKRPWQRFLALLLCVAMTAGFLPAVGATQYGEIEQTAAAYPVSPAVDDDMGVVTGQEYVSLPVTIRDFAADGMLFEYNQVGRVADYSPIAQYTHQTGSLYSGYNWGSNNNLGFRVRRAAIYGNTLPASYEWWHCVICESDGTIVEVLPSGNKANTENRYATLMTGNRYAVWMWGTNGKGYFQTDEEAAQFELLSEFRNCINNATKDMFTITYDTAGNLYVNAMWSYVDGEEYILYDNDGFTLLSTTTKDYVHNLIDDDSISGSNLVQNGKGWGSEEVPIPVRVELNSTAPQYVYGANIRTDLVTAELDSEKKPVYTEATVSYLADLLETMLQVPYAVTLQGHTYRTSFYLLGEKLYDSNFKYTSDKSARVYDLADLFRNCINGGKGTYAASRKMFQEGELKEPTDADTYFDAAYYLLHYLWRDGAAENGDGIDGYGWNQWNYDKINLVQTTNERGEKCYVFNSAFDGTVYDYMSVKDGQVVGSGAIFNTQTDGYTGALTDENVEEYTNGIKLPLYRFDPLGPTALGPDKSFGYGIDQGTYCELLSGVNSNGDYVSGYPMWGEFYKETNYHLTLEGHAKFIYYKDANQYFTFTGDDDVYLYINGKRVLDLGGAHSIAMVKINLNDVAALCGLSDGSTYDFDFYFTERHGTAANFGIETNIQIVDPSMLTTKTGYQNGVNTGYNGFVDQRKPVVYEFALENNGEAPIRDLTFLDGDIGVSLTKEEIKLNELTNLADLSLAVYKQDGSYKTSISKGSMTEEALQTALTEGLEVGEKMVIHGFSYLIQEKDWACRFVDTNGNGIFDAGEEMTSNWYFFNIVYTTATSYGVNNSTKSLTGTSNWVVQKTPEEDLPPEDSFYTNKYVTATGNPNEFVLTLEAFAQGEQQITTSVKPADIVLVLDHSGSMRTPAGAPQILKSGTPYTGPGRIERSEIKLANAKHRGYYVAQSAQVGANGEQPTYTWFIMEHTDHYMENGVDVGARWIGYSVPSTESIVNTEGWTEHTKTQTWIPNVNVPSTLVFYKSQYAMLYDALLEFVDDLKATGAEHNVSIVGFAGSETHGSRLYVGGDETACKHYRDALYHENTTQARRDQLYVKSMKNVQDAGEYAELLANINAIETNYSYTCPTVGFMLANEVLAANPVNSEERDRIVVLFTDGIPNRRYGENDATGDPTDEDRAAIYNEIVQKAYETKSNYGAQVHTICTTTFDEGENGENRQFLHYSSSDYPDAVDYNNPGAEITDSAYTHSINGLEELNNVFGTITNSTSYTNTLLDETAVLKEVLTDYFILNPDDKVDYSVYTAPYNGETGTFGTKVPFNAEVNLSSSNGDGRNDTVSVKGFSYKDEYVSDTPRTLEDGTSYYGSKLIVEVRVRTRNGFWGGNNVPTNKDSTAIYDGSGNFAEPFPEPQVNVPIDVTVEAHDETIYYGNNGKELPNDTLLDQITAGGMPVTVGKDSDGNTTFTPVADWMDDFAEMTWTGDKDIDQELSEKNPDDYTYSVTVTPKYDGAKNTESNPSNIAGNIDGGIVESHHSAETTKTAGDTGHIFVLVPEITFKDSVTEYGTATGTYKYEDEDLVGIEWVFMPDNKDTTNAPDPDGAAPRLELTFTPENGVTSFTEPSTKVDVAVSLDGVADIADVTTFHWENCEHELHAGDGTIGSHGANESGKHEFWVHVDFFILPDTVVIDYGLDVVIDVLSNDYQTETVKPALNGIAQVGESFGTGSVAGTVGVLTMASPKVRFTLNRTNGMQMNAEEVFAYQAKYSIGGKEILRDSTVTVIPATTIYYEDDFVTLESFTWQNGWVEVEQTDDRYVWSQEGKTKKGTQAEDRPGKQALNDVGNIYGYDAVNNGMSQYSMGSSMVAHVDYDNKGVATFEFFGTGFDVIAVTSNATGTQYVDVYDDEDNLVHSLIVDTYYGYTRVLYNVVYKYETVNVGTEENPVTEDRWVKYRVSEAEGTAESPAVLPNNPTVGEQVEGVEYVWVVNTEITDSTPNNTIYQVPVMQVNDLTYGKYKVVITATYNEFYDHVAPGNLTGGTYDLYLDAIRIYDPANDGAGNQLIEDAYKADHEGWPSYIELRDSLIHANAFDQEGSPVDGMVFIDGMADVSNEDISEYISYGPNNEVYLDAGQAVAFRLVAPENVDRIHLGIKSAMGGTVTYQIGKVVGDELVNGDPVTLSTTTDMYYDITGYGNSLVVIKNTGSGVLSITNIKSTYTTNPAEVTTGNGAATQSIGETYISMSADAAAQVLRALKPQPVNPFADITQDQFFYDAVLWAVERGITNGVSADHFGPFAFCNRAQVVTFLWRAAGSPEPAGVENPFTDVPAGSFYEKAVLWALENGITNGLTADTFGPNALCNRAQVVTFLWRANGSVIAEGAENPFTDVPADSFYAEAVLWALENGITTGATATEFDPDGACMRAHVVTFLYRAAQLPETAPKS